MPVILLSIFFALTGLFPPFAGLAQSGVFPFGAEEQIRLADGEVLLNANQSYEGRGGHVEAAVFIDSPVESVWDVMTDYERTPEFIPGLKSCRLLQRLGDTEFIEHRIKFSWFLPEVSYIFRTENQKLKRIGWERIGGDLDRFVGSWVFEAVNGGRQTILIYSIDLDPGFLVPQWLVRHALRKDVPALLMAIRKRVSEMSSRNASSQKRSHPYHTRR